MHQIENASQEADKRSKPRLAPLPTSPTPSPIPTNNIIGTSQPFQKIKLTGGNILWRVLLTINAETI